MDVFDLVAKISLDKSEYDSGLDEAAKTSSSFASKIGTAAKVGATAVAAVGTAAVAATSAVVAQTGAVASYGDNIDKMSQKMGLSAEAYQEWDAVMQHSGTSMETMKSGMKTLANAVEKGNEAFERIGLTQEELSKMSQEEIFAATIKGLQNVENETERTYLAGQLLGRGATELGALLNTSAEETQAMRDRVHELGGVMSDEAVKAAAKYQDSLQDMTTSIDGLKRGIIGNFLPSVTSVMDGITELFSGDSSSGMTMIKEGIDGFLDKMNEMIPKVMEIGGSILSALGQSILDNLPTIFETGTTIIGNIVTALIESLPKVVEVGLQVITNLANSIGESLPEMIPTIVSIITQIVATLTDPENLSLLLNAAFAIISGLAQGIVQSIPKLIESLPTVIENLTQFFSEAIPDMAVAGFDLLVALIKNLPQIIVALAKAIPQIVVALAKAIAAGAGELAKAGGELLAHLGDKFADIGISLMGKAKSIPSQIVKGISATLDWFKDIGRNLISSLWGGFVDRWNSLKDTVSNWGNNLVGFFKKVFGIASPSKVFAEIGGFLDAGLVKGLEDGEDDILKTADSMSNAITDSFASTEITPTIGTGSLSASYSNNALQSALNGSRTLILQVDKQQLGKIVFDVFNAESERVGVSIAGGIA